MNPLDFTSYLHLTRKMSCCGAVIKVLAPPQEAEWALHERAHRNLARLVGDHLCPHDPFEDVSPAQLRKLARKRL